jgi:hypothetical protein
VPAPLLAAVPVVLAAVVGAQQLVRRARQPLPQPEP